MVLTVSFVISPVIGLVVTVALRSPAKLDASVEASGPHDFAVRVQHRSSAVLNGVHRIPPRVRDDRERPSVGRDGAIRKVFRLKREATYFCERGWTGDLRNRRGKSARTPQNITTDRQGANRRSAGVPLYLARGQPGLDILPVVVMKGRCHEAIACSAFSRAR